MKNKTAKKRLFGLIIAAGIAAAVLVTMIILRQFKPISTFLHRNLSRNIITSAGKISSLVPFSLYEALLYGAGIFLIASVILIIVFLARRKWAKAGIRAMAIVLTALIAGNLYFASAGFAYTQYVEGLAFDGFFATYDQLKAVSDYFLDDFNALSLKFDRDKNGMITAPYSDNELAKKLIEEYKRIDDDSLSPYTPLCKTIFSSSIMSEMSVSGVFFAPFGEANINGDMPSYEKPFTMAHELAHAKGIMLEDEANMMAALLTLTSSDEYIRYSGYMSRATYLFDAFYLYNDSEAAGYYYDSLSPLIWNEYYAASDYWNSFNFLNNAIGNFTSLFIDFYLNLMGQKGGSDAYSPGTGTPVDPNAPINPIDPPDPTDPTNPPDPVEPDPPPAYIYPIFTSTQRLFFSIYESVQSSR